MIDGITKLEEEVLELKELREEKLHVESEENRISDAKILETARGLSMMDIESIQRVLENISSIDLDDLYEEVVLTD